MPPAKPRTRLASDGLIARTNGLYAQKKLTTLATYLQPAFQATARKHSRHFIDVFAGPGRNVAAEAAREFPGSPIIAASAATRHGALGFQTVDAFNLDLTDHNALAARFAALSPALGRTAHHGDGIAGSIARLQELDRHAYVVLCLDIESAGQLKWDDLAAIHAVAPRSTDAYLLFPVGMDLTRQLPYDEALVGVNARSLTDFFGDDSWRSVLQHRVSDSHFHRQAFKRALTEAYLARLRTLWKYCMMVTPVKRRGEQLMYYMLLLTNHPVGFDIAQWLAKRPTEKPQYEMVLR